MLVLVASCASWVCGEVCRRHLEQRDQDRKINAATAAIVSAGGDWSTGGCGLSSLLRPSFVLFDGSQVTDEALEELIPHLKQLDLIEVDLSGCLVTEAGARRLFSALDCYVIHPSLPPWDEQAKLRRADSE